MPRYRKLHVKTTESLDINDMPDDFTRLLWIMLPLKLCREGRGLDMPEWIKSQVFPIRSDVAHEQIVSSMGFYHERGMIVRYQVNGRPYFEVVNWNRYQGDTHREAASPYPGPEEGEQVAIESRATPELVVSSSSLDADTDPNTNTDHRANARSRIRDNEPAPEHHIVTDEMLGLWGELFPNKTQPRAPTYRKKVKARLKVPDFRAMWRQAMAEASQSEHLRRNSWFQFEFFVRNDDNWRKCLDHYYASFDEEMLQREGRKTTLDHSMDAVRRALEQ